MLHKKLNPLNKAFKPPQIQNESSNVQNFPIKSVPEAPPPPEKQYYSVFFSKDVKKKHKIFDEGILVVCPNSCQIINLEGKKIYDSAKPKNISDLIQNEEPIILGFSYYSFPYCIL